MRLPCQLAYFASGFLTPPCTHCLAAPQQLLALPPGDWMTPCRPAEHLPRYPYRTKYDCGCASVYTNLFKFAPNSLLALLDIADKHADIEVLVGHSTSLVPIRGDLSCFATCSFLHKLAFSPLLAISFATSDYIETLPLTYITWILHLTKLLSNVCYQVHTARH